MCGIVTKRATRAFFKSTILKKDINHFFYEFEKWADDLLVATRTQVIVKGLENINLDEKYIYIANHTNYLDIPILVQAIPDRIHFVYRQSLQKIPMLGLALKASPFIPIVREKGKNSMAGIDKATEILSKSGSVILFPEGTRSKNGEIAKFKRGAFLIASKSKKKIVPVTIDGVERVMPQNQKIQLDTGIVYVTINKPIDNIPEDKTQLSVLMEEIRQQMIEQKKHIKE
jgi:1-acyl-sn-glycerol-3-phosphate acyltransferase